MAILALQRHVAPRRTIRASLPVRRPDRGLRGTRSGVLGTLACLGYRAGLVLAGMVLGATLVLLLPVLLVVVAAHEARPSVRRLTAAR